MTHLLNTQQASQQIVLRSEDASEKLPFYSYNLANPILASDDHFILIHIARASIPNSFYDIFERNDRLLVTETIGGVQQASRTIVIPSGNYSGSLLASTLQSMLRTGNTINYTVEFDKSITGKFTFSHTIPGASFVLEFPTVDAINRPLGFDAGITSAACTSSSSLQSTHVCDMAHTHSIIVQSELASNSIISSQTMNASQILGEIPITAGNFEMITYEATSDAFRLLLKTNRIDEIKVRLVDQHGHELNLNGLSFSLTLQVDFILKRPNQMRRELVNLTRQLVEHDMQRDRVFSIQEKFKLLRTIVQDQRKKVVKAAEQALQINKETAQLYLEEL